ncbi:MAG: hypothetical protein RLZZ324_1219 [Candidatus Parcubacteria bacterium]|jgi:signal transduction histidine kinase
MSTPITTEATSKFLRRNWQIAYAVTLILLIPATIVLNTFFVTDRFRNTVDMELQRTAVMVGKLFNVTGRETFTDARAMQSRVEEVSKAIPEIQSLDVLARDADGKDFHVVASKTPADIGKQAHGNQFALSAYDNQAIAYLTKSPGSAASDQSLTAAQARSNARYWGVVMPLTDAKGEQTYLLSMKLSLSSIDDQVRSNLYWAYLWLAITVLVVMLMLASNTKLFQYAALYRKLQEVDQMKDDFISMASHELRAPITAIRGYLSLFLDNAFGTMEGKGRDAMSTTMALSGHLATLVEDLLDVSRIEQGRMSAEYEDVAVEPFIEELMQQLKFEAERKKLTFTYEKPAQPLPRIRVDRSRLKQVIINLMSNAIKYTPAGSVIVTTILKDGGMVEIKVTDTGLGMSAEAREKLFQKFYRVRTVETSTIPGTGLGLWITKQIVEMMKGRIFVDSIEKVGTQMSVVFPALKADIAAAAGTKKDAKTA